MLDPNSPGGKDWESEAQADHCSWLGNQRSPTSHAAGQCRPQQSHRPCRLWQRLCSSFLTFANDGNPERTEEPLWAPWVMYSLCCCIHDLATACPDVAFCQLSLLSDTEETFTHDHSASITPGQYFRLDGSSIP
ncbi:hypothetical protein CEXT_385701 [Caerostris extrusa]|uniref:Uncharacterized protein n=1 Tax=Caerostris extrusa TaxID=172846 RepID=A0AAV4WBX4_CAEEX|nr:hypothetical protein CEXT_385701 [Caerostris extrusa]